jgi:hypothetical protein
MVHKRRAMHVGQHLRRRGNTWFFRMRWPARLAACGLTGELIRTLRTTDHRTARWRARIVALRIETAMAQTQFKSKAHIEGLVRVWIDRLAWQHEIRRAETGGFDYLTADEIDTLGIDDARELEGLLRFGGKMHADDQKKAIAGVLRGQRDLGSFQAIVQSAAVAISSEPADLSTIDGRLLTRTILKGYATFLDEIRETVASIPRQISAAPSVSVSLPEFPFLQFWDDFERHKVALHEWEGDTAANARGARNILEKLFPGLTVAEVVSKPIASDLKARILALPRNYARGEWQSMNADQITKAIEQKPVPMVQPKTVNKHFGNLIGYWKYLVEKKHISGEIKNPFEGYYTPVKTGKAARNERYNWPKKLETKFFSSPVFRGCSSIFRRSRPGDEIHRDALFWVPLWGRLTGVRENEICDAKVADIKTIGTDEGDIPFLQIIDGKDSGSERDVPIPDLILDAGFLEYRVIGRDPDAPLFPELIPQGPGQRRSAAFTGKFTYLRQITQCYLPKIDFHSYRGDVETDLKNTSGINSAWIDELIGHESIIRRSEGDRYTKKILLPILRRCVNIIKIEANLTHLKYTGPHNVAAPGRDRDLARYVALAEREMRKKASRKRGATSD